MPFTDQWDVTQPPDTQLANLLGQDIRNLKLDIQQRIGAMSGPTSALPPLGTDAQPANWTGFLFFATDTGKIYRWNGGAFVDVTTDFFGTPEVTSFFNADCSVGISIPAGSLVAGNIIEIVSKVTQGIGGAACQLASPAVGGLPNVIPANGSSGSIIWTVFCRIFISAVGATGFTSGFYTSLQNSVSVTSLNASTQANNVDTTSNISVKMQLGSGCTAGPISVKII